MNKLRSIIITGIYQMSSKVCWFKKKTRFLVGNSCCFLRVSTNMRLDRVGGVAAASLVSVFFSFLQNTWIASWLSITIRLKPPPEKKETERSTLCLETRRAGSADDGETDGAKILRLIPRLFQPFRRWYLSITHFERLCLRMTHSF